MILYFKSIESYNLLYNARNVYLKFEKEKPSNYFSQHLPTVEMRRPSKLTCEHNMSTARNMTSVQ